MHDAALVLIAKLKETNSLMQVCFRIITPQQTNVSSKLFLKGTEPLLIAPLRTLIERTPIASHVVWAIAPACNNICVATCDPRYSGHSPCIISYCALHGEDSPILTSCTRISRVKRSSQVSQVESLSRTDSAC